MYRRLQASTLNFTLIILSGLLISIFLSREFLLNQHKIINFEHNKYLENRLKVIEYIHTDVNFLCQKHKVDTVKLMDYSFFCEKISIFIKDYPKKNYIEFKDIDEFIDTIHFEKSIHKIDSISKLPHSSESDPKIVLLLSDLNETLPNDFYGIIITNSKFSITGKNKVYGTLYSSYKNSKKNISYNKEVIENIDKNFSNWIYKPHSRNLLKNNEIEN